MFKSCLLIDDLVLLSEFRDPTKRLEKENEELRKDYLAELCDLREEFNEMKVYLTNLDKERRKKLVNEFVLKSNDF